MKQIFSVIVFVLLNIVVHAQAGTGKQFKGFEKLENNGYLKYYKKGQSTTGETGGALFIKILFITESDSVFIDVNKESMSPSYPFRIDEPVYKDDFVDVMRRLHIGDSVKFFMSLDSLRKYYPDEFVFAEPQNSMKYLGFAVSVDSIYTAAEVQVLRDAAAGNTIDLAVALADSIAVVEFLKENKMPPVPNLNGIWYRDEVIGQGEPIIIGDSVKVHYTTRYADGTVLDGSTEGSDMTYLHGSEEMMKGWNIGLSHMRVGGKALLIVPSSLARNDGRAIIFEVELISTKHN